MIQKIEGFYDLKEGKEKILDDDLYDYCKEHDVDVGISLLIQIIRLLRKK